MDTRVFQRVTPHTHHTTTQDTTYHNTPQQHDHNTSRKQRQREIQRKKTETERQEKREERREKRGERREKIHFQCGGAWPFSVDGVLCLVKPVKRPSLHLAKQCQVRFIFDFFKCPLACQQFLKISSNFSFYAVSVSFFYFLVMQLQFHFFRIT